MSIVATVSIPAEWFVLGEVLEPGGDIEVRFEPVIPTGDVVFPYLWVPSDHAADVAATLRRTPVVEAARIVDETDDETLFRVTWTPQMDGLVSAIEDTDGIVLAGTGDENGWSLRVRFPDRTGLSEFYRRCVEGGVPLDLKGVHGLSGADRDAGWGLTTEQRDALLTAFEEGYFAVPRHITLVELADELGISDTATSQRLRRGLNSLLATTLGAETTDED